jgi:hypothetical protein
MLKIRSKNSNWIRAETDPRHVHLAGALALGACMNVGVQWTPVALGCIAHKVIKRGFRNNNNTLGCIAHKVI